MRYIFFALLVINGIYFGVQVWSDVSAKQQPYSAKLEAPETIDSVSTQVPLNQAANVSASEVNALYQGELDAGVAGELCTLVGPMSELLYAEYLQEALVHKNYKAAIREVPASQGVFELIVVPNIAGENVFETLYRIQSLKIDAFIAGAVNGERYVSLGRFTEKRQLIERQEQVSALGIQTDVAGHIPGVKTYWVEIKNQIDDGVIEVIEKESSDKNNYKEIKQNVCLGIANN